jgi:hypothetical protein
MNPQTSEVFQTQEVYPSMMIPKFAHSSEFRFFCSLDFVTFLGSPGFYPGFIIRVAVAVAVRRHTHPYTSPRRGEEGTRRDYQSLAPK